MIIYIKKNAQSRHLLPSHYFATAGLCKLLPICACICPDAFVLYHLEGPLSAQCSYFIKRKWDTTTFGVSCPFSVSTVRRPAPNTGMLVFFPFAFDDHVSQALLAALPRIWNKGNVGCSRKWIEFNFHSVSGLLCKSLQLPILTISASTENSSEVMAMWEMMQILRGNLLWGCKVMFYTNTNDTDCSFNVPQGLLY